MINRRSGYNVLVKIVIRWYQGYIPNVKLVNKENMLIVKSKCYVQVMVKLWSLINSAINVIRIFNKKNNNWVLKFILNLMIQLILFLNYEVVIIIIIFLIMPIIKKLNIFLFNSVFSITRVLLSIKSYRILYIIPVMVLRNPLIFY